MVLRVEPRVSLVDQPVGIRAEGLAEGTAVELELSTTDAAGNLWRYKAEYEAGPDGALDTSRDEPTGRPSDGPDPTEPFWAMTFASEERAPVAFAAPAGALEHELSVAARGERAVETLTRRWLSPRTVERAVEGEGFVGRLFLPPDSPSGAVLVVPGSTGAAALAPTAALLAAHGYATLVAAYMREEGLPGALEGIPVETLGRAGARLRSEAGTESIGILSASVGTQGALAALALGSAEADCAIAIAPSSVIWQALPGNGGRPPATAAWSHRGEPLPWLPIHGGRLLPEIVRHAVASHFTHHPHPEALHMLAAYEPGLRDSERADRAAIPVERIECPLLVLAGEDDQMWPGAEMARKIATRRKDAGVAGGDIVFRFPDVGHFLRAPIAPTTVPWSESLVSGGDPAANAYAEQESWATMLDFLGNNMRAGPG